MRAVIQSRAPARVIRTAKPREGRASAAELRLRYDTLELTNRREQRGAPDPAAHNGGMRRIVVVGGGAMGLATAWQLTRRGERPVVLERFARGHTRGASHGEARNFNNAYAGAHYLDLLARAREGWDTLGTVEGEPLLRLHGLVTHGTGRDLVKVAGILRDRGIRAELLDGTEAAQRWPGIRFDDTVLHSADGGVVRAAPALRALEQRITAAGGEVRWNTPVARIEQDADHATVHLADGERIRADVVVVTAGAWTERLLRGIPLPPLRVMEVSPAHFLPRDPAARWPSFNHFVAPGSWPAPVYGMPTPGEGVKVGFHGMGNEVDPDARSFRPTHQDLLAEYAREWMPGLDPATAVPLSCTYTSTPNEAFVLDRVDRMVIGAGFSGHGFKFTPGVGATLADLALDPSARAAEAFRLP